VIRRVPLPPKHALVKARFGLASVRPSYSYIGLGNVPNFGHAESRSVKWLSFLVHTQGRVLILGLAVCSFPWAGSRKEGYQGFLDLLKINLSLCFPFVSYSASP
jgi:hypothetical protein